MNREVAAFKSKSKSKFLVRPAQVFARGGDTVTWVNCVKRALTLTCDGLGPAKQGEDGDLVLKIRKGTTPGVYPYKLIAGKDDFDGESKPEIIVK